MALLSVITFYHPTSQIREIRHGENKRCLDPSVTLTLALHIAKQDLTQMNRRINLLLFFLSASLHIHGFSPRQG